MQGSNVIDSHGKAMYYAEKLRKMPAPSERKRKYEGCFFIRAFWLR